MQIVTGILTTVVLWGVCYALLYAHRQGKANLWLQLAIWAKANHESELFRQRRKKELVAEWAL